MAKFTTEQATAVAAITQVINEWGDELDKNNGLSMREADVLSADVQYNVGGQWREGLDAVCAFYNGRAEQHAAGAGIPVMRHIISNFRVSFTSESQADADYLLLFFNKVGTPPFLDYCDPIALADVRMKCRRDDDGHWRISRFDSGQIFIRGA